MDLHASLHNRLSTPINKQQIGVAWSPLPDGYYKVNIDGSHSNLGGSAWGAGTQIVSFVQGIYCKLGTKNAIWAELWELQLGINLAHQIGLSQVIFELHSKVVVDMINSGGSHLAYLNMLTQEIISLLRDPSWRTSIVHTYKEGNRGANFLASKRHQAPSFDWVVVDSVSHVRNYFGR